MVDFPTHIDTISMGLPIVYVKGPHEYFSILEYVSVPEDCLSLSKH